MTEFGCFLASEELGPQELVRLAQRAEDSGFDFALISDHYHPWIDRHGQSPFVWTVIGAIAGVTDRLRLGTGVTCPTMRIHPAIVAQAAATAAAMMPGRFFLGVGTGENLNEHILGQHWPRARVRLEMLEEAIHVIRLLFRGKMVNHRGRYYTVENARIYTLPPEPPPIVVAASGPRAIELAGRVGDGLISDVNEPDLLASYEDLGGRGKPRYAWLGVSWAESEQEARRKAYEAWPTAGLSPELHRELPLPRHFEQAAAPLQPDDIVRSIVCGPDPDRHIAAIEKLVNIGYDHICLSQPGPDQEGFLRFYDSEVLPRFR